MANALSQVKNLLADSVSFLDGELSGGEVGCRDLLQSQMLTVADARSEQFEKSVQELGI